MSERRSSDTQIAPGDLKQMKFECQWKRIWSGALLVHSNLQMRLSQCYREQRKLLKTGENQRVQTGQVGFLANRRIQPLCHLSAVWFQQLTTEPEMLW